MSQISYQPLHESVRYTLDPAYVNVHDKYLQYVQPINEIPEWSPSLRQRSMGFKGQSDPRPVASVRDYQVTCNFRVRVYTPIGDTPDDGWPLLVYYHGGGWVTGGIESDASFCTQLAAGADCVVASVDYRLAPENKYPRAIDDSIAAVEWAFNTAPALLNTNSAKIGVAGLSAGGGLAASVNLAARQLAKAIAPLFQLLIVPVIDNTVMPSGTLNSIWAQRPHAPYLSGDRMLWFREQYMPDREDWKNWKSSPSMAPEKILIAAKDTSTYIVVADHDILCTEGEAYAKQLSDAGYRDVTLKVVPGATHSLLLLDAVMQSAQTMREEAVTWVKEQFAIRDQRKVISI